MEKNIISKINMIAEKIGYSGKVTEENFKDIITSLAVDHPESFAEELHKVVESAAKFWESANNHGNDDVTYHARLNRSESLYDMVDAFIEPLGMVTDRGVGLYPTYQVTIDGQEYTEYTPLNAMRRYNGFYK